MCEGFPLVARIVNVVDIFEALTTSSRTYRNARSFNKVNSILLMNAVSRLIL